MTSPLALPIRRVSDDPLIATVERLAAKMAKANIDFDKWDRYYSGDQPLAFLAPEVEAQIGDRLAPMVIGWPETITDSVNRRIKNEGFLLGQGGSADDELWRIWTANGMHEDAPLGQVDALVHGLGFISVWGNDEDPSTPQMAFESAHQVAVEYEPGTGDRVVRAALKRWQDDDVVFSYLYLPDRVLKYRSPASATVPSSRYELIEVVPNPLGAVPIVPMVNRGRLLNRDGRSELASVAPLADGINKLATDLMITSEFFVAPRRWMTGVQIPEDPAARERFRAEMRKYQEEAAKSKVWMGGPNVAYGQFPEATLEGFVSGIKLLTSALASIGGLPPDDLGLNQVNPASAEARRAAETVLVLRAEEKQSAFGRAYTRAMRLAVAARDGVPLRGLPTEFARMSVDWRDPATQAIAQEMDAAVKGKESGIYDTEAAQARVGMGPAERAAYAARQAEQLSQTAEAPKFQTVGLPALIEAGVISLEEARALIGVDGPPPALSTATADVEAKMALARQLVTQDGLTLNAAMAAAGLIVAANTNAAESGA